MRVPHVQILAKPWLVFSIFDIIVGVYWYIILILLYILMITNKVEISFIYLVFGLYIYIYGLLFGFNVADFNTVNQYTLDSESEM